jgi:phosphopantetheine adenylyltransferase
MINFSKAVLQQERNKTKNQIYTLNRKVTFLEKFMADFPNAELEEAQHFIAFIDHTDFDYSTIIDEMKR